MRTTYANFLTEDEIEALIGGKDFWLNAEEFSDRWTKRNEIEEKAQAVSEEDVMNTIKAFSEQIAAAEAALLKPAVAKPEKAPRKPRKKTAEVV